MRTYSQIMSGYGGPGFVKSLTFFQVICRDSFRSVENAGKLSEKRKSSLRETMSWHAKKYQEKNYLNVKVPRTKKTWLKLNIAENVLSDSEGSQEKSEQVLERRQHES